MRVVPARGGRVVARFTNGLPALVEQPVGTGRIAGVRLGTRSRATWNTFPRQATFVPFVLETLRYLAGPAARACRPISSSPTCPTRRAGAPGDRARSAMPPRPVAVNVDLRESGAPRVTPDGDRRRRAGASSPNGAAPLRRAREREARRPVRGRCGGLLLLAEGCSAIGARRRLVWDRAAGSGSRRLHESEPDVRRPWHER